MDHRDDWKTETLAKSRALLPEFRTMSGLSKGLCQMEYLLVRAPAVVGAENDLTQVGNQCRTIGLHVVGHQVCGGTHTGSGRYV
jgi:hypothetical protein